MKTRLTYISAPNNDPSCTSLLVPIWFSIWLTS